MSTRTKAQFRSTFAFSATSDPDRAGRTPAWHRRGFLPSIRGSRSQLAAPQERAATLTVSNHLHGQKALDHTANCDASGDAPPGHRLAQHRLRLTRQLVLLGGRLFTRVDNAGLRSAPGLPPVRQPQHTGSVDRQVCQIWSVRAERACDLTRAGSNFIMSLTFY